MMITRTFEIVITEDIRDHKGTVIYEGEHARLHIIRKSTSIGEDVFYRIDAGQRIIETLGTSKFIITGI